MTTVLGAVFGGVLLLGQAVVARHRAAAAADLSALAAATSWSRGPQAACAAAARVARAQGAAVTACELTGEVAEVTARAADGTFTPGIRARAAPPPEPPLPPEQSPPREQPLSPEQPPPPAEAQAPVGLGDPEPGGLAPAKPLSFIHN
ncbi:Rv3654c family TadE-like protein [Streptomyces bambusae]|uniref:Rv3654c family TadE-like protein n=1 Tax=Streptomyces bambusae TaxID=1550616 RepID=UPI0035ABD2D8